MHPIECQCLTHTAKRRRAIKRTPTYHETQAAKQHTILRDLYDTFNTFGRKARYIELDDAHYDQPFCRDYDCQRLHGRVHIALENIPWSDEFERVADKPRKTRPYGSTDAREVAVLAITLGTLATADYLNIGGGTVGSERRLPTREEVEYDMTHDVEPNGPPQSLCITLGIHKETSK